MHKVTARQRIIQALILSKLTEKPMRYKELRKAVKFEVKSDDMFAKNLSTMVKQSIVYKDRKSKKNVLYSANLKAEKSDSNLFSIARKLVSLQSTERLYVVMQYLAKSSIFQSEEESVEASINYWFQKYRNFTALTVMYSLLLEGSNDLSVLEIKRLLSTLEEKYFLVLLRFRESYPEVFRNVLETKQGLLRVRNSVNVKASELAVDLEKFLKENYLEAYKRFPDHEKAILFFELHRNEREFEKIFCGKDKKEVPIWICKSCRLFKRSKNSARCIYQVNRVWKGKELKLKTQKSKSPS
jgi:hypothetical protein